MHKQATRFMVTAALAMALGSWAWGANSDSDPAKEQARVVLQATGIKGGLVVHVGCGRGELTAALRADERFVVQGLEEDANNVEKARQYLYSRDLYGPVSVDQWNGSRLPYTDNLVNLLVVEEGRDIAESEIMRVLAPRGAAYVMGDGEWRMMVKPRPREIDKWSHYLHGPDNNAVAHDEVVGPPKHVQWICGPRYARSHETNISLAAMVTSDERLFYIWDDAPTGVVDKRLPDKWKLIARDAFNGKLLWQRPMPEWGWRQWHAESWWDNPSYRAKMLRMYPATLPRRLAAAGDRIYVTLGYHAPVSVLDAASGEKIRDFEQTSLTDEILLVDDNILVLNVRSREEPPETEVWDGFGVSTPEQSGRVMAVDAKTGKALWESEQDKIAPVTLAARNGQVYYSNYKQVVCLDMASGDELWRTEPLQLEKKFRATCGTLVAQDEVVLYAAGESQPRVHAFSAKTGELIWKGPNYHAYPQTPDLFVADGLVWLGNGSDDANETKVIRQGFDPVTGEVRREIIAPYLKTAGHHWRCYRSKATDRYLLLHKRGIEFLDLAGSDHMRHDWVRPPCVYGVLPANGLSYFAPHPCVCYPGVLLDSFNALAAARPQGEAKAEPLTGDERLHRGPAWERIARLREGAEKQHPEDWPMYRHDPKRSGSVVTAAPVNLKRQWRTLLGGELTPPVVADGRLLVAEKDAHTVHALDAESGERLWRFTAGGRIDSPPAIYGQLVLFGCADGRVYCLWAADGQLVWRFVAAPQERRILVRDQLESVWPVHGSVLLQQDAISNSPWPLVYFTAGRSSLLDGGIHIFGLDLGSGRAVYQNCLEGPYADPFQKSAWDASLTAGNMDGAKSDILVSDGADVYLFQERFRADLTRITPPLQDRQVSGYSGVGVREYAGAPERGAEGRHLITTGGLLDATYNEGTFWTYSRLWPGWSRKLIGESRYGQLLVFNEDAVFGDHVMTENVRVRRGFTPGNGERLFARGHDASTDRWSKTISVRVRGMVLAGDNLFVAGAPDVAPEDDPLAAYDGRAGGVLCAMSAFDGEKLADMQLEAPPVFDGLIAAKKRLYLSDTKGEVLCFAEDGSAGARE